MRLFKKLLKLGGILSLLTFVLLSSAFLVIWAKPNLVLKTSTLKWGLKYLPQSIALEYGDIALDASSLSFFRKQISLSGKKVCVKMPTSGFTGCFENVSIKTEVDIFGWFPTYVAGPIELTGGRLVILPVPDVKAPPAPGAPSKRDTIWPTPPAFLESIKLAGAKIEILSLDYGAGETTAQLEGSVVGSPDGAGSSWKIESAGEVKMGKDEYEFGADIALKSIGDAWFGPYFADLNTSLLLPDGRGLQVKGNARPRGAAEVDYSLDVKFRDQARRVAVKATGEAGLDHATLALNGDVHNVAKYLPRIGIKNCKVDVQVPKENKKITSAKLDCPIIIGTNFPSLAKGPYAQIVESMAMLISVDGKMISEDDKEPSVDGNVTLKMDNLLSKVRHGSASLQTSVKGSVANFPSQLDFDTNLEIAVEQFQKVVQLFDGFPWAVPVPLNSLKGPIALKVAAKGKLATGDGVDCPIVFRTRLKSPSQKLDLDGDGKLHVNKTPAGYQSHVDFKLVLADIRVVLPYLNLGAPPRLMPDARIHNSAEAKRVVASKGPKSFTYKIVIETPVSKPLRLASNLAKNDIPITLSFISTDEVPLTGSMRVANFDMELFRRVAQVHHVYLGFNKNPDQTEIDGEIRVAYTDYTVKIKLLGLLAEPEIKLASEPALPENEIWAVLLYGRRLSSLDSGEASSVGSASAAVADQAVSLASMYVLASTPVESIGYDPATGVFKAKVRLADGTSLNVGTDLQRLQQVGVRQRLGKNWYINTYLENPLEPLRQSLTTFLEWSIGY